MEQSSITNDDAPNWLLRVAYEGAAFHGWQRQGELRTVQLVLEQALTDLFGSAVLVAGCSRTDAGVHALDQCVSVRPPVAPPIPPEGALRALNGRLPDDLRIRSISPQPPSFHARSSSVGKRYAYLLATAEPLPFLGRWTWRPGGRLDLDLMRAAAGGLLGTWDFTPFTVTGGNPGQDPVKTLHQIEVREMDQLVKISVVGDAFLYKMVRRLVGFLVAVGQRRLAPENGTASLRGEAVLTFDTAPACGLFLEEVFYEAGALGEPVSEALPFMAFGGRRR